MSILFPNSEIAMKLTHYEKNGTCYPCAIRKTENKLVMMHPCSVAAKIHWYGHYIFNCNMQQNISNTIIRDLDYE